MKKLIIALVILVAIGALTWFASAPTRQPASSAPPMGVGPALGAPPPLAKPAAVVPAVAVDPTTVSTSTVTTVTTPTTGTMAPIATESVPVAVVPAETAVAVPAEAAIASLTPSGEGPRPMIIPVAGVPRTAMHDMFNEVRGNKRHEAIDILAPRGTPVIATDDGVVKKLFTSVPGGLTVYQYDPDQRFCYYYAHLDHYAAGLHEGQQLHRGEVLGYVGTTGNAPKDTPHLHFALIRLDPDKRWWKGTYVDPYPVLAANR